MTGDRAQDAARTRGIGRARRAWSPTSLAVPAGAIAATAILFLLVRPVNVGPVGFDSAASVIHFDRIVNGQRLEAFVTTTPKPLLTLVYGLVHAVLPDWRAISLVTLAAAGLAIALVTALVMRGSARVNPWSAALAVPLLLVGSPLLVTDVGLAYAIPWALAGWAVAGLGAIGPRPRAWLVGLGLMLATLARLETIVVTAVLVVALTAHLARRRPWRAPSGWDGRSLFVALAVAGFALPIMLAHDWLLTGDPMFWARVSAAYSAATADIPTPIEVAKSMVRMVVVRPVPSVIAAIGLAALWRNGSRSLLAGLLAMGPGLALLLLVMAWRGTYVSGRYYAGIELALAVAAAVGAGAIATVLAGRLNGRGSPVPGLRGRSTGMVTATLLAAVVVAASVFGGPFAPLDRSTRSALSTQRIMAQLADRSLGPVAALFADRGLKGGQPMPAGAGAQLYVPALLRPRLAVDLDLPLWAVGGLGPAVIDPAGDRLRPGVVIVHARQFDKPAGAYEVLETRGPVRIGAHVLETVATPDLDTWVLRVP